METREVSLPIETWEKLDNITRKHNRGTNQIDLVYLLHYYLKLCEISDDFSHGVLPNDDD